MDINTLLNNVIGALIANIPALIGILTTVSISLNRVKNTTSAFPDAVANLKESLSLIFSQTGQSLQTAFLKSTADFSAMLESFNRDINRTLNDTVRSLTAGINDALVGMKNELSSFNDILLSNRDHINYVALEQKLYIDILATMIAKDPQLVREGVTQTLMARVNRTKEELESFPLNLVTNPAAFESAVKEVLLTAGREKFEEMLRNAGYEAKKL